MIVQQHLLTAAFILQQPINHSRATIQEQQKGSLLNSNRPPSSAGLSPLRGRSYTTSKAEQPTSTSNLFVSLDFLQQPGQGVGQSKGHQSLLHRASPGSAFWESPDLDSSSSEQEWRRGLASDADPVHKSSHRSSSREPPGATRIPSRSPSRSHPFSETASASPPSASPFAVQSREAAPLSRDRASSTSRLPQRSLHLAPWATDTGSPLRQTVEYCEPNADANRSQAEQRDEALMNNSRGECIRMRGDSPSCH
jgi:hypothetical protein